MHIFASLLIFKRCKYMQSQLRIRVFLNSETYEVRKPIFERIVNINDSLNVPFNSLVSDLQFMFGKSSILCFEL